MRKRSVFWLVVAIFAMRFVGPSGALSAGELHWSGLAGMVKGTPVEIPPPQACDRCKKEFCVTRTPVQDCVKGKKKVYDCKVCNEYASIPETRYRFKEKCVTEKIPCCYCKPVCKTGECTHCYETEQWDERGFRTCAGCGGIYCKHCENKTENLPCKYCGREPGQTTVTVHYKSCVKVPYTVYRQVKQPVCVKEPRYEHVMVPITRYECDRCGGKGCNHCCVRGASDPGCEEGGCEGGGCEVGRCEEESGESDLPAAPVPGGAS